MAAEKETIMVLKADLQCPCCYKKIRKTLCKFPQIRDQVYNEKSNEVTIKVVCCSPERIRDKLCCKGGKSIKSIKIVELQPKPAADKPKAAPAADKPKEAEKPKEKPKEAEKPKEKPKEAEPPKAAAKPKDQDKPKDTPKGPEKPKDTPKGPEKPKGDDKPKGDGGAPPPEKPKDAPKPEPAKVTAAMPPAAMQMMGPGPAIVHGVPSVFPYNGPSQDAYPPGPYYHGYGFPPPSQPIYDGYYGHGHGHGHGQGYGYGPYGGVAQHGHVNRDNYFSDENPQTCTIM